MIKAVFSASPCDELESVYFSMIVFDCAKNTTVEMKALSSDVKRIIISRPAIENRMLCAQRLNKTKVIGDGRPQSE